MKAPFNWNDWAKFCIGTFTSIIYPASWVDKIFAIKFVGERNYWLPIPKIFKYQELKTIDQIKYHKNLSIDVYLKDVFFYEPLLGIDAINAFSLAYKNKQISKIGHQQRHSKKRIKMICKSFMQAPCTQCKWSITGPPVKHISTDAMPGDNILTISPCKLWPTLVVVKADEHQLFVLPILSHSD